MSHKAIYALFAIIGLTLIVLSIQKNPQFYYYSRDYNKIVVNSFTSDSVQYKSLDSSCKPTSQYRYNSDRTGVAPPEHKPRAKVEIYKHIRPLNIDIHNASKSSPTVDESGLYIGSDSGWFFKMDHDGKIIWRFYVPGSDNGIHGSAALDDKKVYIGAYNGILYALDKENGELVWANPVGDYIGASPLLADGNVYISAETSHPDGMLVKLDCNTGKTIWSSQWLGGHSHSSPSFDRTNDQIIVGANSGRVYAFKNKDGSVAWKQQLHGQVKGTATIWKDRAFISSWDKNYHALSLKTGESLWKTYVGGRNQSSLTLAPGTKRGVANAKTGQLIGLNLETGTIEWTLKHGDRNHMFSVLVTQDPAKPDSYLAWSRCKTYELCVVNPASGELIHSLLLPESFTSVPFAYKDKIYISLDKNAGLVILQ